MCMGRTRDAAIAQAAERYAARIPHYMPFELRCLPDVKTSRATTEARQKEDEGKAFLAAVSPGDFVVLLDERGRQLGSRDFAGLVQRKSTELQRNLVFIIGGPYGFSPEVYDRADMLLSLSAMTFPHELVRLFFVEQLYRAMTIMRGEPYHHD